MYVQDILIDIGVNRKQYKSNQIELLWIKIKGIQEISINTQPELASS